MRPAALVLLLLLAACAPQSSPAASEDVAVVATPTAAPTPRPTPAPTPMPTPTPTVYWPLRGAVAPGPEAIRKRPVLVRIPNDVTARPQTGLATADMVWELLAEGGITRYMAVYHSQEAPQVGPIRSARLSDLHYAPMLRGILAHVGASAVVLGRIRAAAARGEFIEADQFLYSGFYTRVASRAAPQNVYTSTERIREAARAAGDPGIVDVPPFDFGNCGARCPASTPASTFSIPYLGAMFVTYSYDAAASGYHRAQAGVTTVDAANNAPVTATNVVIIHTDITPQPGIVEDSLGALSLEIRSTGTGRVEIFTGGRRYDGKWSRQGTQPYRFADETGAAIPLAPGQTWVHVVYNDWAIESAP